MQHQFDIEMEIQLSRGYGPQITNYEDITAKELKKE